MDKEHRRKDAYLRLFSNETVALESMAIGDLHFYKEYLISYHKSKFAKAELYLIGGYKNELFELTYYTETLVYYLSVVEYQIKTLPIHPGIFKLQSIVDCFQKITSLL